MDLFTHLASQILVLFSLELMVTLFSLGAENVGLSNLECLLTVKNRM